MDGLWFRFVGPGAASWEMLGIALLLILLSVSGFSLILYLIDMTLRKPERDERRAQEQRERQLLQFTMPAPLQSPQRERRK